MNSQHHPDDPDSFDELLKNLDRLPETRPDLAESIFTQTRGVLSRRRWMRRGRVVVACLICYAVGLGSGWLLKPRVAPQTAGQPEGNSGGPADRADSLATPTIRPLPMPGGSKPETNLTKGVAKEGTTKPLTANPGGSQFENFRRAGDRQLFERGNIRSAMDCYRRALAHATAEELRVEIDRDSWLLMSLKQSRLEERKHVRQKRV